MAHKPDNVEMKPRSVKATDADWEQWLVMAREQGVSLSGLIRQLLKKEAAKHGRRDK